MTAPRISPRVSDDLFESSSMTFGEHLEQLRKALAKASLWVGAGLILGLFFANDVVQYIQTPLKAALEQYALKQDLQRLKNATGFDVPVDVATRLRDKGIISEDVLVDPRDFQLTQSTEAKSQPAATQTEPGKPIEAKVASELPATPTGSAPQPKAPAATANPDVAAQPTTKQSDAKAKTETKDKSAPAVTTKVAEEPPVRKPVDPKALYNNPADAELVDRLVPVRIWRKVSTRVETLNIQEGFMIWLKAALICGIVFGSPGIFWHIWGFVAAGLYPHERKYVYFFLPMSLGLFLAGVSLAFFVIFRFVIEFLLEANASLGTDLSPRLNEYVSFALILPLGFGLAFQLPLVMVFLNRIGMFTVQNYLQQWKIAILVIAFLSMILTPGGDIYSMCGMGIPLIFLYFLGIALCHYLPMGRPMGADGYDPVA
jgi:sec-independent protein translocase protein TatC